MPQIPISCIVSSVKETIECHHMISPSDRIGVAVSGGLDSVVLLDILTSLRHELQISLLPIHLNHGIRGAEADRDEVFVKHISQAYDLPCLTQRMDVPHFQRQHSLSLEDAARKLRYQFFARVMEQHNLNRVALGHTADDQVETILMRFIKGGGARGLSGMPPIREGRYIRPLLNTWRDHVYEYAQLKGLSWVEDSSNTKITYFRNRVRHELIPYLKQYNPNIKQRVLRVSELLATDDHYLQQLAHDVSTSVMTGTETAIISIPRLLSVPLPLQVRVLQDAFNRLESGRYMEYPHLKKVLQLVHDRGGSKRIPLPGGFWAKRVYDTLTLEKGDEITHDKPGRIPLETPGRTLLRHFAMAIDATIHEGRLVPTPDRNEAYLDYDRLALPLHVRSCRPGDSFVPLGMSSRKKLKNFFIDLKVPRAQRGKIPLVISATEICWVAGWRIDDRFKIGDMTQRTLKFVLTRS